MKILISAAEISSDIHGARVLGALGRLMHERGLALDAFGIGGPALRAAGMRIVVNASELLVMGSSEIIGRLPRIIKALGQIEAGARVEKPDVALVIDYPDFHFRLLRKLKKLGVPVVYLIPPKVWVWRNNRIEILKTLCEKILCVFPFEEEFYKAAGAKAVFVGNPLLDELPFELSQAEARLKLKLGSGGYGPDGYCYDAVLALLPGSRPGELKRHLKPMLRAAAAAAERLRRLGRLDLQTKLLVLMPLAPAVDQAWVAASADKILGAEGRSIIDLRIFEGQSAECLVAANAALVKSGTSTLEAGLLACPHAVIYKASWLTEFVFFKLIRRHYRGGVGLVNIVASRRLNDSGPLLVPEIIGSEFSVARLTDEIVTLLTDEGKRAAMRDGFKCLKDRLRAPGGRRSSDIVAMEILSAIESGPS